MIAKGKKENIISIAISVLLSMLFTICNGALLKGGSFGIDSSVFRTVALMMDKGFMPYKDSVDHKGPIIYILNWIGIKIDSYWGLWIIEILVLTATFWIIYKISRLSCSIEASIIVSLLAIASLFKYYQGGNFTEEYAMPCIGISIYIFIDYINNNIISKRRLIISGISLGAVLLLRPNMISLWIVYCFFIGFCLLIKKQYAKLINFITWFFAGILIIVIPIFLWLLLTKDLFYLYKYYWEFNILYASAEGGRADISARWSSLLYFLNDTIILTAIAGIIIDLKNTKIYRDIIYIVYLLLTLTFMVMSGDNFDHYGMVLVPAVAYPLSLVFSYIEKIEQESIVKSFRFIIGIYVLSVIVLPKWISSYEGVIEEMDIDSSDEEIVQTITSLTATDEPISVYGIWNSIYIMTDRPHATTYSYQFPIGEVMPEILDDYFNQLQNEQPRVVVVEGGKYDERIQAYLEANDYNLCYLDGDDIRYCGAVFYKMKE